ncbi:DHCW motif cupin fold protein [Pseudomonas sp. SP16.1]|uniref:DHCW motif cupin fold protein n=1 Tax=Pseudomonas sp. SP16.1 TaxID=3458854 RepID=UPI00404621EF
MQIRDIPFGVTDWAALPRSEHPGERGMAYWRTCRFGALRVRMVEYSPGYLADHWCHKGHVLLCLEGALHTELEDGRVFVLEPGMSYQVADGAEAHRSSAPSGARLFVVD